MPWSVYLGDQMDFGVELRLSGLPASGLPTELSHWPEDSFAKDSVFRQDYIYV